MYKIKTALKIITYISVSIVLMLFFLFVLTYNLESVPEKDDLSNIDYKNQIDEIIEEGKISTTSFNETTIKFDNELITNLLNYFIELNNNTTTFETEYWSLSEVHFEMIDSKLSLTVYATFHGFINYKLKFKTYFNLSYVNGNLILEFNNFKVGYLTIPDRFVSSLFRKTDENTIGFLIKSIFNGMHIYDIDSENLTVSIPKNQILETFSSGLVGDFLIGNDSESLKESFRLYVNYLIENDQYKIKFEDTINLIINTSKFKNIIDYSIPDNYESELNNLKENKVGSINNPGLILYNDSLSNFDDSNSSIIKYKYIKIDCLDSNIYLSFAFNFLSNDSVILYKITKEDNKYFLSEVTIGKDDEETNSYAVINIEESLLFLDSLDIDVNEETYEINIYDLFKLDNLTLNNVEFGKDSIILSYQD